MPHAVSRIHRVAGLEFSNDLERPALAVCGELGELFQALNRKVGVPGLMVCGSGSTLCAVFEEQEKAALWKNRVRDQVECIVEVAAVRRTSKGPTD